VRHARQIESEFEMRSNDIDGGDWASCAPAPEGLAARVGTMGRVEHRSVLEFRVLDAECYRLLERSAGPGEDLPGPGEGVGRELHCEILTRSEVGAYHGVVASSSVAADASAEASAGWLGISILGGFFGAVEGISAGMDEYDGVGEGRAGLCAFHGSIEGV
jgi:hypothetical protein